MRRKRHTTPLWLRIPLWAFVVALVSWGIWEALQLRRSLLAEVHAAAPRDLAMTAPANVGRPTLADAPADALTDNAANPSSATNPARLSSDPSANASDPIPVPSPTASIDWPAETLTGTADELLTQGETLLKTGHIVQGRTALNAALHALGEDPRAQTLREELATLNAGIFLGTAVLPDDSAAAVAQIQPGDTFLKIGRAHAIPAAFLEAINPGLNPRRLRPLTGMKIIEGPFNLCISKHAGRADLFARNLYVRSFSVTVEDGNYLPAGPYRLRAGGKIQVGARVWIGLEGTSDETRDVTNGWLYGNAGPRQSRGANRISGAKLPDADLLQLYNVLVETRSTLRVQP